MPYKPPPNTRTPQSAQLARGDTVQPPMNESRFNAAGLPEGLRPAYGLGKPRTGAPKSRAVPQSRPAAPKAKSTKVAKRGKGY
jgi:hypothetical protein